MSDINYGNILEALNDKADRDLQNVTPPPPTDYIVESYSDDEGNWWKLYKSGWLEQGARVIHDNTKEWKYQTFLKPFKANNYTITIAPTQLFDGGAGTGGVVVNLKKSSNTQFCWFWNANSNYGVSYTACGQSI